MTDHIWLNQDGSEASVNIIHGLFGDIHLKNLYFKEGNRYFRIEDIRPTGNKNEY